ncbi:hypothetical protein JTE90_020451 [Oedothorax gibbosus]|uniref:Ionotropic glutamate receptor L-glutamate and glycine-binding domain-containing protein n=1 Tax=Oedothorax gibbosus TaxID=931172 RepID=A0AAV6UDH1_9ARAC|nr:hypothetical protein JTE90_020451 [Oedothorax gibbosus]
MANRWNTSVTTKLRVAYSKLSPFVDVTETENGDILGGFMPNILKTLGEWMNLELYFIREPMDLYGGIWKNNTYNGMVGMLYRNEVDLIMNPVLPQEEFYDFLYYSNPITVEAFTILSGKTSLDTGLFPYLSVLDFQIWIGIAIALFVVAATSAQLFISALHPASYNYFSSTGWYCWNLFSCMLKQSPRNNYLLNKKKRSSSIALRILVMIWVFGVAFLVMNVFQSLLVTKMTLRKSRPLVDTLSDLGSCKDCVCLSPREVQLAVVIKPAFLYAFHVEICVRVALSDMSCADEEGCFTFTWEIENVDILLRYEEGRLSSPAWKTETKEGKAVEWQVLAYHFGGSIYFRLNCLNETWNPDRCELSAISSCGKKSPMASTRKVWAKINNRLSHDSIFRDDIMLAVESGKFCVIHGHLILEDWLSEFFARKGSCNTHLSTNYFYPFPLLMAVHRRLSPLFFETLNLGITRLVAADITGKWFKSSLKISNLCTSYTDSTLKPVGMNHIHGVLLLWAVGIFIAAIVLMLEILLSKLIRKSGNTIKLSK